ncbi:hypothetical protein [Spirillospora sp. NPDC029432]|uniref:hypothetical protein n=1 Tax=Spirillospora sp. NPDC029432 TaxID=3154599 RepID=UPI0034532E3D
MKIIDVPPLRRAAPAALAVLSAAALAVAAGPVPAARADAAWTVQPSPFTLGTSGLYGVSAAAPDAVTIGGYQWYSRRTGMFCGEIGGPCVPTIHQNPVLQRWNGGGWSWISTPELSGKGQIKFVDAVSAADAWAAGSRDAADGKGLGTPYVARSGAQGWEEVAAPSGLRAVESLDGDAAGAWIAGTPAAGGASVYRWADGAWTPHAPGAVIQGIRQRAADDVWAVGRVPEGGGAPERGFAARFDGTTWHTVTPPQVRGKGGRLVAVLPLAADDVWITGYVIENGARKDASYHWNGSTWREDVLPGGARFGGGLHHVYSASVDEYHYRPDGLADDGAGGLWAVPAPDAALGEPHVLRFTDGSWRLERAGTGVKGQVQGLARVPGTATVWAVGQQDGKAPLVLRKD